ncbi:hypothetical protein EVAR_87536_1 [Eumeta japonica]|uniref:Uncharacterized protein n=1 Tax=Eumeta variegata TaxID=151549 RepID=A0A4C1XQX2_EUMVA|nr:hypothetical protein EVAR_87536_1 [Eumeta japonica]
MGVQSIVETKIEIDCGSKIRVKNMTGIGMRSSTEMKIKKQGEDREAVQANMLEEMLRAQAASAMEHCALPNRRLRIQISDIHSCGGEKKDPRTTIDTCHR